MTIYYQPHNPWSSYLMHHGIKGQKWGVRNGPPYPLGASQKSKKEKKSDSKSQKKSGGTYGSAELVALSAYVLTEAILMTSVAVAARQIQNKRVEKEIAKNKAKSGKGPLPKIKGGHSEEQDSAAVNPGFNTGLPEYRVNCVLCTTTYELRRRGYDVKANTSTLGRRDKDITSYFNIDKKDVHKTKKYDDFVKDINSQPDGSRGNVWCGCGPYNMKHSMAWEKRDGKVRIIDTQSNTFYDALDDSIINRRSSSGYSFMRTDNAEINWDNIRDAVSPRG